VVMVVCRSCSFVCACEVVGEEIELRWVATCWNRGDHEFGAVFIYSVRNLHHDM